MNGRLRWLRRLRHNNSLSQACRSHPEQRNLSGTKETKRVLMIRLARVGARKQPYYRVVVIEKERARNGRPVEVVGTYNPRTSPATFDLKRERITYWVSKGAKCSERVTKLLALPAPAKAEPVAPATTAPAESPSTAAPVA